MIVHQLEQLQKRAAEMTLFKRASLAKQDLEETALKASNPATFLQLLHFCLVQFSHRVYYEVLEQCPEIKILPDRKFVESAFRMLERLLEYHPSLTVEQFLTQKYLAEKVQMLAEVMQLCIERDRKIAAAKGQDRKARAVVQNSPAKEARDEPVPPPPPLRVVRPTTFEEPLSAPSPVPVPRAIQMPRELKELKESKESRQSRDSRESKESKEFKDSKQLKEYKKRPSEARRQPEQQQLMQAVTSIGETVSELVGKFEQLQQSVRKSLEQMEKRVAALQARL